MCSSDLKTTGEIKKPTSGSDTAAFDTLVSFIQSAHPMLRNGVVQLTCAENVIIAAKAAYKNMTKSYKDPNTNELIEALRDHAECQQLQVCTHPSLGSGSKLMLHKPGLFDIGREDGDGSNFVQIRAPYEDPNEVQFWIQDGFGTRVNDVHEKVFCTNEQVNKAPSIYGDYTPETPAEAAE